MNRRLATRKAELQSERFDQLTTMPKSTGVWAAKSIMTRDMSSLRPVFFILLTTAIATSALAEPVFAPTIVRQRELAHLVRQDCGSCHGLTLQGGLGPSLRAGALKDKPIDALVATIHRGRPGSPMPPWDRFISEDETRWIVEQLLKDGLLEQR